MFFDKGKFTNIVIFVRVIIFGLVTKLPKLFITSKTFFVHQSAPISNSQQERLIEQIKLGGENASIAMRELYNNYNYSNYLKVYQSEFGVQLVESNDFLHYAFLKFMKIAQNSDFQAPKDINVYITSIAKNLIQNHSRKKTTETIVAEDLAKYGVADSPSIVYAHEESKNALKEVLGRLKPHCRRVLRLWQHGFSYLEISSKLDLASPDQARQHKHRCLKKLVQILPEFPELKDFSYE